MRGKLELESNLKARIEHLSNLLTDSSLTRAEALLDAVKFLGVVNYDLMEAVVTAIDPALTDIRDLAADVLPDLPIPHTLNESNYDAYIAEQEVASILNPSSAHIGSWDYDDAVAAVGLQGWGVDHD